MVTKCSTIWLLLLVGCCSAGERVKRIGLSSLFFPSNKPTASPYPVWKVHKYTGLQLQPLHPLHNAPLANEVAPFYGVYPTEGGVPGTIDLKDFAYSGNGGTNTDEEETHSTAGGLVSLLSLIPGGLSGILSLSSGSVGGTNEAEDRSGLAKGLLLTALKNKKEAVTALTKDGIGIALRTGQATKNWVKDSLSPTYYQYPVVYHRKSLLSRFPIIGRFFGSKDSFVLPEVHLPAIPELVGVKEPPQLPSIQLPGKYYFPIKSGSYVKVDFSGPTKLQPPVPAELPVPGTSYGVPDKPAPVPTIRPAEEHFVEHTTAHPNNEPAVVANPETVPVQVFQPYPQLFPYPPELPEYPILGEMSYPAPVENVYSYPVSAYPYPPPAFSYSPVDYYETSGSELQHSKAKPVYKHLDEIKAGPITENEPKNRHDQSDDESSTRDYSNENDQPKKKTEDVQSSH